MKAFFIISILLIFSIATVLVFSKIPADSTTQTLSLSNMQAAGTSQPTPTARAFTQGPQRPSKVSSPVPQPAQPGQSTKFTIKSLNEDVIEIGTERHSPPKPYVQLSKWDGEALLKVSIPFETGDNPEQIGDKLRYFGDGVTIDFYPKQPEEITQTDSLGGEHKFLINDDGGVEFHGISFFSRRDAEAWDIFAS